MDIKFTKGIQSPDDPLKFIMSDESVDRMGDVILAKGWDLTDFNKNPIALWGHDSQTPIGTWDNVKVEGKALTGTLTLAKQGTSAEIDTIRALVDQRILKSVSVGFVPDEMIERTDKQGNFLGYQFTEQQLHECSLVSVPANPNAVACAKSCGLAEKDFHHIFTSPGQNAAPIARINKTLGTAAKPVAHKPKEVVPMKIADKITAKKERTIQIRDRLTELKTIAEADDAELSDEETLEIDTLSDEMEAIDKSIASLEKIEATIAAKAIPAKPNYKAPADPVHKEKGGDLFAKVATAKLLAKVKGVHQSEIIKTVYPKDERIMPVAEMLSKTAVVPATTTLDGWASQLVRDDLHAFLVDLEPVSVYAALRSYGMPLEFNGAGTITIPSRDTAKSATNDLSGSFVGEGGVIPVKRLSLGSQTLARYKAAVISTYTQEILEQSTPSIEAIVRQGILDDTSVALDSALTDASALVTGVRPAGLLNGVSLTTSAGDTAADVITDLKVLFTAMNTSNLAAKPVLMMHPNRKLGLSTITNAGGDFVFRDEISRGMLLSVPVIISANIVESEVYIVDSASFAAANDVPTFAVSDQATLTMANADGTAPTQSEGAAGAIGTAEQVEPGKGIHVNEDLTQTFAVGAQAQSLYQTYTQAIRMILPTSWAMVRTGGVAGLDTVSW